MPLQPAAADHEQCAYNGTTGPWVPGTAYRASVTRYQCTHRFVDRTIMQRVDIVRFSEGDADPRVYFHAEFEALVTTYPDGREVRQHSVKLYDTQGLFGYTKAEYSDKTAPNRVCDDPQLNVYTNSHGSKIFTSTLPVCVPRSMLLP